MKNLRPLLSVNSALAISEPVLKVPYDVMKVAKSIFPGSFTHRFLSGREREREKSVILVSPPCLIHKHFRCLIHEHRHNPILCEFIFIPFNLGAPSFQNIFTPKPLELK